MPDKLSVFIAEYDKDVNATIVKRSDNFIFITEKQTRNGVPGTFHQVIDRHTGKIVLERWFEDEAVQLKMDV